MSLVSDCPCGSQQRYDACCGRLHRGAASAETAEELMRSRYAAFALGEMAYVFRTWHPATRPEQVDPDPSITWTGLEIVETVDGGPDDENGVVEFEASCVRDGAPGHRHERSRFVRRRERWAYLDGEVTP